MTQETTSQAFFERLYQHSDDPWAFASSIYEQGRYNAILRALSNRRFERAFEPGCSIGVLTARLAEFCDRVEAMDISATAVRRAQDRCAILENVTISHGALPESLPGGSFDLVVFSEIGYYFQAEELTQLARRLVGQMSQGGILLAAHWLGTSPDHVLSGDAVHAALKAIPGLTLTMDRRYVNFRMNRWTRT